ncbi:MAG: Ig-like domain-containing protein [Pedobacter sp.]
MRSFCNSSGGMVKLHSLVALFLMVLFGADCYSAPTPIDVSSQVSVTYANERSTLDRVTRNITSTADITLTNTSSGPLLIPLHAVITINNPTGTVSMPEALGGLTSSPYNRFYYDLGNQATGGQFAAGAKATFSVKFVRKSGVSFTYVVTPYGVLPTANQPPVAAVGPDQAITLLPGQSSVSVQLDGSASRDPDGSATTFTWTGNPDPSDEEKPTVTLVPGSYTFTLVVTDDKGAPSTPASTRVTVNRPPAITTQTLPTGKVDQPYTAAITASDPDGDILSFSLVVGPTGMTINSATGALSWMPVIADIGSRQVSVTVSDGRGGSDTKQFSLNVPDTIPPTVTLSAPAEAAAGANAQISINASDNRDLKLLDLRANGIPIWSGTSSSISAAETVPYRLSPDLAAGDEVVFQAKAYDVAGNEGAATATIRITQVAMGPGYIQGKVLDDSRGLLLSGAEVSITPQPQNTQNPIVTQTDGGYFAENPSGSTLVRATKPGYTTVERLVQVMPEKKVTVLDARLTKIHNTTNVIDPTGGVIRMDVATGLKAAMELAVPAGGLGVQADIRLTPISNQGLAGVLPAGWSPVAAVDIRLLDPTAGTLLDTPFTSAAALKLPVPLSLSQAPDSIFTLAVYDSASHQWKAVQNAIVSTDGLSATADIQTAGQYALLVADPAPNAPPVAVTGTPLNSAIATRLSFDAISAAGSVVPQAAPPSSGLKAAGEVVVTAKEGANPVPVFTSGAILNSRITEKYDLKSGDKTEPPVYTQNIVIYRVRCLTNMGAGALAASNVANLRTTFPVSPSRDYTITDLLLGKVGLEITLPDITETGVMVGTDGGRFLDADGNILQIPAGALGQTVPVSTKNVSPVIGAVGDDFTLIRVVEVNLTRQNLTAPATLSIPAPSGTDPNLSLVVAKQIDVKGVAKLKLVALARQNGSFITSEPLTLQLTNSSNSINASGVYYFLQAKGPIGFVTGTVTDAGNTVFNGALVKTDKGSLVDLTQSTGRYLLAAPITAFTTTAVDLYKNDEVSGTGALTTANQILTLDLKILMISPAVVSISPANNATNVQPNTSLVVTFSKSLNQSTVTTSTLVLKDSDGNTISGVMTFSIDARIVTLSPSQLLISEKSYTLTLSNSIKDVQGYSLGSDFVSGFTVRKTTPPPMPAAGSITATFPDADGFITITATQGSAEPGNTVLLINDATGEIVSVTAQSNGSFTGRVRAQLGDEIKVVLMDHSGNQTVVSYITYKSDDGKYLVTAKGGTVEGEAGSQLEIPEGALFGPTVLKVTAVQEANLPSPVPEQGKYLAAFNIDSGGVDFQKEVHLSIPVPDGFDTNTPVFVTRPSELVNADGSVEKVYEIVDSTKVINGRITTASPPFSGIVAVGTYVFILIDVMPVIVSGYTYQEMNDQPDYQKSSDLPIKGAVIRSPDAMNYVSYSDSKGHYATFSKLIASPFDPGLSQYRLTAIHPLTMFRKNFDGYVSAYSYNLMVDFKLGEKSTVLPDKTPPDIEMNLKVVPGQPLENRIISGTIPVGTELQLSLFITDQSVVEPVLTVEYKSPEMDSWQPYPNASLAQLNRTLASPQTSEKPAIWRYPYQPTFPSEVMGSQASYFKPTLPGLYRFTVEANDGATPSNKSSSNLRVRVVKPGDIPAGIDGAPVVDSITPVDGSKNLPVTTAVTVWFSEPVNGISNDTVKLMDTSTNEQVSTVVSATLAGGRSLARLTPLRNLSFDRQYQVKIVSAGIADVLPNPSVNNSILQLDHDYQSTFTTQAPTIYTLNEAEQFSGGRDIALFTSNDGKTYAYIAAGNKGWRVVDVSDPNNPKVVYTKASTCAPSASPNPDCTYISSEFSYQGVAVHPDPNQALMAMIDLLTTIPKGLLDEGSRLGYIRFYDLAANPIKPLKVGQEQLSEAWSGTPHRVAMWGDYAYVSTAAAALQVVSISAAKEQYQSGKICDGSSIVGVFDSIGQGYGSPNDIVVYAPGKAILTTNPGYLLALDINNPTPVLMSSLAPAQLPAFRVAAVADYTYEDSSGNLQTMDLAVSGGKGKLKTVNLTDPYNPVVMATVKDRDNNDVTSSAYEISINKQRGLAFVTSMNAIQVVDLKDPWHPRLLNTIPPSFGTVSPNNAPVISDIGSIPAVVEKNGWLYMADQNRGIRTLDFDAGIVECNKDTLKFPLERVHHLSQFSEISSRDYYTDSYQVFPIDLRSAVSDMAVTVTIRDHKTRQDKQPDYIPEKLLPKGSVHSFVLDYQTVIDAGFKPTDNSEFDIKIHFRPIEPTIPESDQFYVGFVTERTDGEVLGQSMVNDVMLQDGSLNLSRQDLAFNGRGPQLGFYRSYNNKSSPNWTNPLGKGWNQSLDMRLVAFSTDTYTGTNWLPDRLMNNDLKGKFIGPEEERSIAITQGQAKIAFTQVSVNGATFKKLGGVWSAGRGNHGTLTENSDSFVYTEKDGTKYTYGYPKSVGEPTSVQFIEDRNGNRMNFAYDENGLLKSVTDAVNRTCSFTYENMPICDVNPWRLMTVNCPDPDVRLYFSYTPQGYLQSASRGAKTERYDYAKKSADVIDSEYNLVKTTDAIGNSYGYKYFASGAVTATIGPNLPTIKSEEVVKAVVFPDGNSAEYTYTATRTVTDPKGNDTVYSLNNYGNPLRIEEPLGKTTTMTWSIDENKPDNVMTSRTDPRGFTTTYEYDPKGNITRETDPYNNSIVTTWNQKFSLPETRIDRNNVAQSWTYDSNGNLILQKDGEGKDTNYTNYSTGERESMRDPLGNRTSYTYDQWGNPDRVTGAKGSVTDYDHDVRGRLIAMTDPNGRKISYTYDQLDYPLSITYPTLSASGSGGTKTFSHDLMGNLLSETDRAGLTLSYTYTPRYQVKDVTRSAGGVKSFEYDANGNLTTETDWKGIAKTHAYDELNRRVSTANRLVHAMSMGYDLNGNLTRETDFEGRVTAHNYDSLNRLTRTALLSAPEGELNYSYFKEVDPKSNLKSETDQEGNITSYTYNGRYQRSARTNSDGTHQWNYDGSGNLASETDEEGRSISYEYDGQNRPVKVTRPLGSITAYQYDPTGNRTMVTDSRGNATVTSYDEWNRPWKVTDPENYTNITEYDGEGRDTNTTDGNGVTRRKTRDSLGQVLSFKDGEGNTTSYSYDLNGNVLTVGEPNGTTTTNTYDVEDRLLVATEADATGTRTRGIVSRDRMGNPLQVKDYNGNLTTTAYNALNLPITVTNAMGKNTFSDYYKNGKVKNVKDRRGNSTAYEYDGMGRVSRVTDPLSQTIVTSYDKVGNVKSITDKRGIVTTNTYDALNRLTEQERAGVRLVTNEYDGNGNKIADIDAVGNRTEYDYGKRNLLDTITFADATARKRSYDGNGNLKAETDELSRVTSYTYDRENRPTSVEFAGETTRKQYDVVGNLTETIKPLGNRRSNSYDSFKQLVGVTEGNLTTRYAYDNNGNLLKVTDPGSNETTFTYDLLNRKTRHALANGNSSRYSYDEEGNLITFTDAKDQVTSYSYDMVNRPVEVTYSGSASPFYTLMRTVTAYDGNNNATSVSETKNDQSGAQITDSTVNVYDNFDRLTSSTQRGVAISYAYDNNGNRTGVTTPNGATTYAYDSRNRVATATTGTGATTFSYYLDGSKRIVAYPNGTTENLEYYPTRRVRGIVNKSGDTIISSYAYDYDHNGNRTKQIELQNGLTGVTTYGYDNLDRLLNHTLVSGIVTTATDYTYAGYNRASEKVTENGVVKNNKIYSYDNTNRLILVADSTASRNLTYSYDANGNTVKKTDSTLTPAYTDTFFDYDSLDRLVRVRNGGYDLGLYDYDDNNLRIRHRNSDRGDVDYYYDGRSVIEERNRGDNSLLARYSYADELLSLATSGGSQYYHHDALGSTVNLTDLAGATKVSYFLNPWGMILNHIGDSVNRQVFTGKEHDQNTGLVYFGARYYDPDTGRFISQDEYLGEAEEPPSLHRYLYAYSNPTFFVDLEGYESIIPIISGMKPYDASIWGEREFTKHSSYYADSLYEDESKYMNHFKIPRTNQKNISSEQHKEAIKMFGKRDDVDNLYSNWNDRAKIIDHYKYTHPATINYSKELYRLIRSINPIHSEIESCWQVCSGKEMFTGEKVSRIQAGFELLGSITFDMASSYSIKKTRPNLTARHLNADMSTGESWRVSNTESGKLIRYSFDELVGRYRDTSTGRFVSKKNLTLAIPEQASVKGGSLTIYKEWPDNGGFLGNYSKPEVHKPGQILSRIGDINYGRYVSPLGTSRSARGLPSTYPNKAETLWEVIKAVKSDGGIAAPWKDASGLGVQYKLENTIKDLWDKGKIKPYIE